MFLHYSELLSCSIFHFVHTWVQFKRGKIGLSLQAKPKANQANILPSDIFGMASNRKRWPHHCRHWGSCISGENLEWNWPSAFPSVSAVAGGRAAARAGSGGGGVRALRQRLHARALHGQRRRRIHLRSFHRWVRSWEVEKWRRTKLQFPNIAHSCNLSTLLKPLPCVWLWWKIDQPIQPVHVCLGCLSVQVINL